MAPFSYRALTSWKNNAATGSDREVADFIYDEQREPAVVADPLAQSAVTFGLGKRGDDIGEGAEVDAAPCLDGFHAQSEAQMGLAGFLVAR